MPVKTYRAKPKAQTKRGYVELNSDKSKKLLKNKEKIFKELFKDERELLKKHLQSGF